jgi:hypothetical protein
MERIGALLVTLYWRPGQMFCSPAPAKTIRAQESGRRVKHLRRAALIIGPLRARNNSIALLEPDMLTIHVWSAVLLSLPGFN